MILNEDYFEDLEIKDEDIVVDDTLDVEEPELTLEEAKKLPEQYNNLIRFQIDVANDRDTSFIQTTLIPRIFKRLDAIFELYGIEHSQYVLSSYLKVNFCDTVIKFGNYQLFCGEEHKDIYTEDTYKYYIYINVYVNYPVFNYKRAFRFIYTVINLLRNGRISLIKFEPNNYYIYFSFWFNGADIEFACFNNSSFNEICKMNLGKELTKEHKREFYKYIFRNFFGEGVYVPYRLIDRDVPLKPIILNYD